MRSTKLMIAATAILLAMPGQCANLAQELEAAIHREVVVGDLKGAIDQFEGIAAATKDRAIAAKALLHVAGCYEKLGAGKAREYYKRILRDYPDQKAVAAEAGEWLRKGGDAVERPLTTHRLWAGNEVSFEGGTSPDGRYLAYVDWTTRGNIAIRDLGTGEKRLVTNNAGEEFGYGSVSFSPDGKQVAYQWCCRNNELRVSNTDGSSMRVLMSGSGKAAFPFSWSPDGKTLAAVLTNYSENTNGIILVSVANGSLVRLKTGKWDWPNVGGFSLDGKFLTYSTSKSASGDGGVFVIAVDGSAENTIINGSASFGSPAWSPDGTVVVFTSDRSGMMGLWAAAVRDGKSQRAPELIKPGIGDVQGMGFGRDGSYFYGTRDRQQHVYVAEFDAGQLAFRSEPQILSNDCVGCNSGSAWSPDGKLVVFARTVAAEVRFVVKSMSDGSERVLPNKFERPYFSTRNGLSWIGNRTFLVTDTVNSRRKFWAINADTGEARLIMDGPYRTWPPAAFSPDGKTMYYSSSEKSAADEKLNHLRLLRRDLTTNEERSLYEADSTGVGFFGMTVSPGGDQIGFMANTAGPNSRSLYVIPSEGGAVREIYKGTHTDPRPASATWTKDGRYIITASGDSTKTGAAWKAFSVDGGASRLIEPRVNVEQLYSPSFSPDGQRLVFSSDRTLRELWVVKNLLPQARPGR